MFNLEYYKARRQDWARVEKRLHLERQALENRRPSTLARVRSWLEASRQPSVSTDDGADVRSRAQARSTLRSSDVL